MMCPRCGRFMKLYMVYSKEMTADKYVCNCGHTTIVKKSGVSSDIHLRTANNKKLNE